MTKEGTQTKIAKMQANDQAKMQAEVAELQKMNKRTYIRAMEYEWNGEFTVAAGLRVVMNGRAVLIRALLRKIARQAFAVDGDR